MPYTIDRTNEGGIKMKKAVMQLETLTCPSCVKKIETALTKTAGVSEVEVLFNSSKVKVAFDETVINAEELDQLIQKLGYPVIKTKVAS